MILLENGAILQEEIRVAESLNSNFSNIAIYLEYDIPIFYRHLPE